MDTDFYILRFWLSPINIRSNSISVIYLAQCILACDETKSLELHEGNLGQIGHLPWLGVLRVHFHEDKNVKMAVTGAVLVRDNIAIVNAQDVSRLPRALFKGDSMLMFIWKGGPWSCRPLDYTLHPEYEYSTYNTIAMVEFDSDDDSAVPILPICWPENFYNTSNELYAVGFTDERKLLEKVIHKVAFIEEKTCDEFYHRAQLEDKTLDSPRTPQYLCILAINNHNHCLWDNGMVLVSNATGTWKLVGFGLRGQGCKMPVRFINTFKYQTWLKTPDNDDNNMYYYNQYQYQ